MEGSPAAPLQQRCQPRQVGFCTTGLALMQSMLAEHVGEKNDVPGMTFEQRTDFLEQVAPLPSQPHVVPRQCRAVQVSKQGGGQRIQVHRVDVPEPAEEPVWQAPASTRPQQDQTATAVLPGLQPPADCRTK